MARTLLIVDDISINREILKKILGDEYQILEADDGVTAMAVLSDHHASLSAVLLDLSMPVMNGFDVLARMRKDEMLSLIPVIVTTGQTEEESEVKALALGANDYIAKPYNATIIKHRIRNTIKLRETAATVTQLRHDKLTGLYAREWFFEKAEELIAAQAPGYYVMGIFNIDGFKVINDQYDTAIGDEVLRHIAGCIKRCVEPLNGICCRITADHFAMLYPKEFMDDPVIRQCHKEASAPPCLSRPIILRGGRYIADDPSLPANAMYDRARLAEVSTSGRYDTRIALYDESMRTHILHEQQIVNEMAAALSQNQFEIWFQPQFNHATGALIGAEGLVRWRHPQRGLIFPGEFIPIFERNGFIYDLDKYVWEQACYFLRKWLNDKCPPIPISVNISRYDLLREDIVSVICALKSKYSIPSELLRFEITETAFADSFEQIISVVERLIAEGFTIEIDDFGSGYSSLNTLKDVPADILKLDMRFLEGGRNPVRGGNIIQSVVRMARWLGMPIIAEGVETIEQADFLKTIGCNYIQGYLYAKPMPAGDFEVFSRRFHKEPEMSAIKSAAPLDQNMFWDPRSMETLIFNSYVGGACILEYHDSRPELLRINDSFARELGCDSMTLDAARALILSKHLDAQNKATLIDTMLNAISTGRETSCEVMFHDLSGEGSRTYVRVATRVIATADTHSLLYCSIFNTTALRETERKEREAYSQMLTLMNDMPGGFCRMRVSRNGPPDLAFANDGFCTLLGMKYQDVISTYGFNALGCVHPDDIDFIMAATNMAVRSGSRFSAKCRLLRADGSHIPVMVFGRFMQMDSGNMFLNAYFTDIAFQAEAQDQQRELLDNLPCGAAHFQYENGTLKAEYFNSRYRKYVGRAISDPAQADAIGAIHPDDRAMLFSQIESSIVEGRDVLCSIRLRYGDAWSDYRSFRFYGNVVARAPGVFSIYAFYLPQTV